MRARLVLCLIILSQCVYYPESDKKYDCMVEEYYMVEGIQYKRCYK